MQRCAPTPPIKRRGVWEGCNKPKVREAHVCACACGTYLSLSAQRVPFGFGVVCASWSWTLLSIQLVRATCAVTSLSTFQGCI